jgi:hypothetical protein
MKIKQEGKDSLRWFDGRMVRWPDGLMVELFDCCIVRWLDGLIAALFDGSMAGGPGNLVNRS